jgi:DNA-binding LytR/AlgR family response regulator
MKVLIIEDEKVAADKLEQMIYDIDPEIEIKAKIGSIKESVTWLMQHSVDLIFLDIQLSDGISFSIFDTVHVSTPIIFTTAYDQYAIKAFQLNSIAYLLKPIRESELNDSLTKYKTLKSTYGIDFDLLLAQVQGKEHDYKKRFLIQIGDKLKKIDIDDIAYFYVLDKAVYLRLYNGKSYPLEYSLDKLETILNPDEYFRINRKYIVSMNSISNMLAYSRGRVKIELKPPADDEFDTIVSIDRSSNFKMWLNQ